MLCPWDSGIFYMAFLPTNQQLLLHLDRAIMGAKSIDDLSASKIVKTMNTCCSSPSRNHEWQKLTAMALFWVTCFANSLCILLVFSCSCCLAFHHNTVFTW